MSEIANHLETTREMKESGIDWIGEIPKEWGIGKVKDIFKIGRGRVISKLELDDDGRYPVFSSQTLNNGCLGYINTYDFDCKQLTWTTDGANAGEVFYREGKHNCTNVCGTLQLKNTLSSLRFQSYYLRFATQYYKRPDINGAKIMNNEMANILLLIPPLHEQQAIANYLDEKVGKIDEIIAEQNKVIEHWNSYKQSLITEIVTKGLNSNVEMKDSGIEWIGENPKEWELARIKDVSYCLDAQRIPISAEMRISGNIPYWGAGNIVDYIDKYIFNEELVLLGEDGAPFFDKNRPVAFYINNAIWANNHIHVLRKKENIKAKYLTYSLNCVDYYPFVGGSIISKLTQSSMKEIKLPLPPIHEQQLIANFLDEKCSKIDQIIKQKKEFIEQLKEYKQSLIYECVTGKRKIKE